MKLESINIKRFRSIENLELTNCGQFNVLIGKNNSGKSNILSAIQAFFACIQIDNVITYEPPFGKKIDFFKNSKPHLPIEIALNFSLSLAERDALIQDIVKEAPQMRNAIEGIDPTLLLTVVVTIAPASFVDHNYFGYVSKIALISPPNFTIPEKTILKIDAEPAIELYGQVTRSHRVENNIAMLRRMSRSIDRDDWRVAISEAKTPSRLSARALVRRYFAPMETNEEVLRKIEAAFVETTTYDEFISAINTLEKRMQEEITTIQEEPLRHKIDTFAGEESSVPTYVVNLIGKIAKMKVLYLREQRRQIGKDDASRLLSLKTKRGGPEVLRNLQETVSALLGVKIDAFESDSLSGAGKTVAELDVDEFLVEVNGSGIREALRLVLDVEFEHPHILLVEEPEIHLHPALETTMMLYLKRTSSERQVFLTTHSTNFLDTAEMKNVYLISKPTNSTKVQLLDFEEAESQIPKELGIRLSSLFMFDRLVFVEGKSDAAIIREWASVMRVNLNQSNVGFIPIGGSRNIGHYAAQETLSFLKKRQVTMWILIDRDERDDIEISKLKKALGQRADISVWKKREIENYLICPRAIARFIKLKKELALSEKVSDEVEPAISDIIKTIDECADKLKQITIDKRVARRSFLSIRPWLIMNVDNGHEASVVKKITDKSQKMIEQLQETINQLAIIYEEEANAVNAAWQADKLNLVPGDVLLDMVCQRFNVRYKKELDGVRLAALLTENEIDDEIKEIIRAIGN